MRRSHLLRHETREFGEGAGAVVSEEIILAGNPLLDREAVSRRGVGSLDVVHRLRPVPDHERLPPAHGTNNAALEPAAAAVHERGIHAHRAEPAFPVLLEHGIDGAMADPEPAATAQLRGLAHPSVRIGLVHQSAEGVDHELLVSAGERGDAVQDLGHQLGVPLRVFAFLGSRLFGQVERQMDEDVRLLDRVLPPARVADVAGHGNHRVRKTRLRLVVAHQPQNEIAVRDQIPADRAPDRAGGAGDENRGFQEMIENGHGSARAKARDELPPEREHHGGCGNLDRVSRKEGGEPEREHASRSHEA